MGFITIKDAIEKYGYCVGTYDQWIKKGFLKSQKRNGNIRVIDETQLVRLLNPVIGHKYPDEELKPVKGFEGRFVISNYGRLISVKGKYGPFPVELTPAIGKEGYYMTQLRMKPKNLYIRIHTLVASHFVDNDDPENKIFCNHKDGNKLNNHYKNLEWVTPAQNCKHAVDTGLMDLKGEKHPHAKLTTEIVIRMREMYKTGKYTQKQIGSFFGVERRTAHDAITGKCWGHLPL